MSEYSIYLRAFEPDDYIQINKWRNNLNLQTYTGGPIRFVSSEMEKEWVRTKMMDNTHDLYLAICLNDGSGKMIGYISLNKIDHLNKTADAGGTVIGEKEYQDGVTVFESLKLLLDYAFLQLNINRITASCLPNHYLAPYSLQAFGFEKEGFMRQCIYKNGRYQDMEMYSLLRKDYDKAVSEHQYEIMTLIKRCIRFKKTRR